MTSTETHVHSILPPDMIPVEEARARILEYFAPLEAVAAPLLDALGQVLAEDVVAPFDIPPLDNTAMDGYAVRAADTAGATHDSPRDAARHRLPRGGLRLRWRGRSRRGRAHHDRRAHPGRRRRRRPLRGDRRGGARRRVVGRTRLGQCASTSRPRPARTSAPRARTCARATSCCRAARCSGRRSSACSPRSASPRRACIAVRASPSSRPATSCCAPASRPRPARYTTPTRSA